MKKLLLMITCVGLFASCGTKPANEEVTEEQTTEAVVETAEVTAITGFDSIEDLCTSLVKSIQDNDYESYFSHVMNEEMELAQAELITDEKIKKEFLHEYGFSLHEEEAYFNELISYYEKENVDLQKATVADMEYVEYKGGEYEPLKLYEVFIPIEMEYESLIDFTIIKVDEKYYLTSEIGI